MALYCLVSPGGSPGVTTTALALALSWPWEVLLAECDPAGRRVLPGFMADRLKAPAGPGLLGLAMAGGSDAQPGDATLDEFTIPIPGSGHARLLHGIRDPRHAQQLVPLWPRLAKMFTSTGTDVIADLGRIGSPNTPVALLARADLIVMVLRPSLAQVDAAQPRLDALLDMLASRVPVGLCLIDTGPYPAAEVSKALSGLSVLAELPDAPPDARVLSDGAAPRLTFRTSMLMRAAGTLGQQMRDAATRSAVHAAAQPEATGVSASGSGP